jgi:site-specific recombinase XerD
MAPPIRSLFDEFIHECKFVKCRRPDTIRGYEATFGVFLKFMPDLTVEAITPETVARFCEILMTRERIVGKNTVRKGVMDSTVAAYQRKLNTFFIWLVTNGHIEKNPLDSVARIKPKYEGVSMLRRGEIERVRAAVENHSYTLLQTKRDRAMISILLFCGLRKGELIGLRVTDVSLERMTLTVRAEPSKSTRGRQLPINPQLYLHLEDYLAERNRAKRYATPALFVSMNRDRGLSSHGLKAWVGRLRRLSRVRFHLHQFRHTFASNLATKGLNAIQLQKLMGHSDLRMLQTYVGSLTVDDLRAGVATLTFDSLV